MIKAPILRGLGLVQGNVGTLKGWGLGRESRFRVGVLGFRVGV